MKKWLIAILGTLAAAGLLGFGIFRCVGTPAGLCLVASLVFLAVLAFLSGRFRSLAFTTWTFAFIAAAMYFPDQVTHHGPFEFKRVIVPLIQVIMFGMGATLTLADFAQVMKMPRGVLLGVGLQYAVMPLMGYSFARIFGLTGEVAAGLILVGACSGGVASNVICYIAGANVALSVSMTAISTLLSPVMTPLAMKIYAGQFVEIAFAATMFSILKMILLPVILGVVLNRFMPRLTRRLSRVLPMISMLGICVIIAITIGLSRDQLLVVGLALLAASVCHNAAGLVFGYWIARLSGLNRCDARAVSIEVGMQNGGMATGLAFSVLHSEVAAMASAIFGPWSAVSGSVIASWWRRSGLSTADNDVDTEKDSATLESDDGDSLAQGWPRPHVGDPLR